MSIATSVKYEKDLDIQKAMIAMACSENKEKAKIGREMVAKQYESLVYSIIKERWSSYLKKYAEDLMQIGMMALFEGLQGYDPEKGAPSTYFKPRIQHEISHYINEQIHHLTMHEVRYHKKVQDAIEKLAERGNLSPTYVDIAYEAGIKIVSVQKIMKRMSNMYDESIDASGFDNLLDENEHVNPEEKLMKLESNRILYDAVRDVLTKEQHEVVARSFGLYGRPSQKYNDIMLETGITIDRIPVILRDAMRRLRSCGKIKRDYYGKDMEIQSDLGFEAISTIPDEASKIIMGDVENMDEELEVKDIQF